ncbi:DUF1871 family protein [Sutcliffiella cohnii]|nr:DUF1871 family protein [Sutcliffiella sp. NC1]WBL14298.1 DUF1871 family protein [Sutcliffiella sp. NC1]
MNANIHLQLMDVLMNWDPLQYGEDAYETERVDIIQAVHELEDIMPLAKKIQAIIEFSFEEIVPLQKCVNIANELLLIKNSDSSCSI